MLLVRSGPLTHDISEIHQSPGGAKDPKPRLFNRLLWPLPCHYKAVQGWKFMWKVQKMAEGEFVLLNLGGRMEGSELTELQSVIASVPAGRKIALDLRDLKLVDQETVTFLARCETGGNQLRNCPAYIREWINRERT
jgi:hypothetical protein